MCGITGLVHFDKQRPVDQVRLKSMADIIAHRGPDGEGFYINANVGLAHRRLSIIDLSGGDQPMYNDRGNIVVVFNGEIYNYLEVQEELEALGHRFRTASDTEVIIRAYEQWGIACQEKFNGMWTFALWDDEKQHLFVSRDRMGEKPLHYTVADDTFIFGSEIKSIGKYGLDLEPNLEMLELYLFLGYMPEPYTFYKNIHKLKAGHYLLVKGESVTAYQYWDLTDLTERDLLTDEKAVVREFSNLFHDSVRIRMRSDVPYGAFLSGGLDSSSIVAVMSEISSKPIETFTIGFQEKQFDERDKARVVADKFRTNHHEHIVELSTFDNSLRNILFHYDEPFADPAAIPTEYVSQYASEKVKMVLTGDGADEVLAGYSSYQGELLAGRYHNLPGFVRNILPQTIEAASTLLSGGIRYKLNKASRVLHGFNASFQDRLISKSVKIQPSAMKTLFFHDTVRIEDFMADVLRECPFRDPFYQMMYYNLKVSLPGQMLVKVDRMSMAHSLETRAPFLDHRLVEYMYRIDKRVKLPALHEVKNVLRKSMAGRLPQEIIQRKKKGFDVPLREWFKDDAFDRKLDQNYAEAGLNDTFVKSLLSQNKAGQADHGTLIWRLVVYTNWLSQYKEDALV
jgi:asparagine synthase (glutamine-hydrolysing)